MAFEDAKAGGDALSSIGAGISSITGSLFGTGGSSSGSSRGTASSTQTQQLELDEDAVTKIISDILGSESGLANIFSKENAAGIFNSSVGAQASGDLVSNLVGELAKLTGKTTTQRDDTQEQSQEAKQKTKGLFSFLGI